MRRLFLFLLIFSLTVPATWAQAQAMLTPFQNGENKFGYKDAQANVSIDPRFDEALPFSGNYALVRSGNQWGIINSKGKLVIPAHYEDLGWSDTRTLSPDSTAGIIGYKQNGHWGLLSLKNKPLTPPLYDYIAYAGPQRVKAGRLADEQTQETQYGIIDPKGKEIIPLQYSYLSPVGGTSVLLAGNVQVPVNARLCPQAPCNMLAYGLLDNTGKELLPLRYQRVNPAGENRWQVAPFREWKLVKPQGPETIVTADELYPVLPQIFAFRTGEWTDYGHSAAPQLRITSGIQDIRPFAPALSRYTQAAKYGLKTVSAKGELADFLPARYDSLQIDANGLIRAGIRNGGDWSWEILVKDQSNVPQKITSQAYEWIDEIKPGHLTRFRLGKRYGYLDSLGTEIIPAQYDSLGSFRDSLCVAVTNGKYGILKRDNTWQLEPKADFYDLNAYGHLIRRSAGTTDIMDLAGKKKYASKEPLRFLPDGSIEIRQKDKVGRISPAGVPCVPAQYDSILPMTSERTFWAFQGNTIHLYSAGGEMLLRKSSPIERLWYNPGAFSLVQTEGKFGFVDEQGRLRIANRYTAAMPFTEGLAAVQIAGKWGFITEYEKIAVQPYYQEVTSFAKGYAFARRGAKWGVINRQGKELSSFSYDAITAHPTGTFITTVNGKKGMLNAEGMETITARYDEVIPQTDGNAVVQQGKKYGLLSGKGVSLFPPEYDSITLNPHSGEYLLLTQAVPFEFTAK